MQITDENSSAKDFINHKLKQLNHFWNELFFSAITIVGTYSIILFLPKNLVLNYKLNCIGCFERRRNELNDDDGFRKKKTA